MSSFFALIQSRSPVDPEQICIETATGSTYTWKELNRRTSALAGKMASLGLRKGDRVASQVEKSPEALFLYLACLRSGLIYLPMNTSYQNDETDYIIGNAEPSLWVTSPARLASSHEIAKRYHVAHLLSLGTEKNGTLLENLPESESFAPVDCAKDDVACILYTSGTTGRPKGAMLTHGNLAANALDLISIWEFASSDVLLHALPIFHVHGLFVATHCALLSGAKMIWLPKFEPRAVLEQLPRSTVLMGVPTFYTRLLKTPELNAEHCRRMRLFISGSAPLLGDTFRQFRERTGFEILERYGMTETGMNTSNPLKGERRPGSVGFPLPSVSARIATEAGEKAGMIQIKGPNVFKGYWKLPGKSAEDFTADGWFITGDLGQYDSEGYLHIVGRAKDLIITGGYNVYPKEIETWIDQIDGVEESAVIGVPDPDFGEAVAAVIKLRGTRPELTEKSIIALLKEKLARYKVPRRIHFVDDLPRNTMGKVQKKLLRSRFS